MIPLARNGAAAGALALAAALVVGCFSDHQDVTAPIGLSERCREVARAAGVPAGNVIIGMEGIAFTPASVTITRGQTVTWVNCEPSPIHHTATSDDNAGSTESWRSPYIGPPATYTRTFTSAGSNPYYCDPHPFMTGTIVVT